MRSKREQRPETVICGNLKCARTLSFSGYRQGYVDDEVEPDRVHWRAYPLLDGDSVLCPCGHYTAYYNSATRTPPPR